MTDAEFYDACLTRLDELIVLGRLLLQAATAGAWAAGVLVGLLIWRLIVLAGGSRWGLALLLAAVPSVSSAQQAPQIAVTIEQYVNCGVSGAYGQVVFRVILDIGASDATPTGATATFSYIDLPSPLLQVTNTGDPNWQQALDDYLCYYTAYPPVSGSQAESTLRFLQHWKCGSLTESFTTLWLYPDPCGEWGAGTIGFYMQPYASCGSGICYPDSDGDGVPDNADPSPNDPEVCGDSNSDGVDDCATSCITDIDGDGVVDCQDDDPDDQSSCGDFNDDGVDDCEEDGEIPCFCEVDNDGQCCGGVDAQTGIYECGECGCVDDPETPKDECPPICYDDPDTELDECDCWDDPSTEEVECDEGDSGGCKQCSLNFDDLKEKVDEVLGDFDFLPRTLDIQDQTFVVNLRIVNPISQTPIVPLEDTRIEFDYLFMAVDADGYMRAVMEFFRVMFRAFCLFVITAVLGWKLMTFTLGG